MTSLNCPWDSLTQTPLGFCEEVLCSWIKQPGNTWTNVGFVVVGLLILRSVRAKQNPLLRMFSGVALFTGIGSAFFHTSGTHIGAMADYFGMFSGTAAMTALNVRRWRMISRASVYLVFLGTFLSLFVLMAIFPQNPRTIYAVGSPCCFLELALFFRDRRRIIYRNYLIAWGLALVATLFWWVDESKVWCNPSNHFISGHGVWHLLGAASMYFFYAYYGQFDLKSSVNN